MTSSTTHELGGTMSSYVLHTNCMGGGEGHAPPEKRSGCLRSVLVHCDIIEEYVAV